VARIPGLNLGGLTAGLVVAAMVCLAGATRAAEPPRGIIALNQFGQCPPSGPCGALRPKAAANTAITGLMIRLNWKDMQSGPKASDIDWTMTDNVFAQAGKDRFVVLSFVPGIQTPDWAMDEIPKGGKISLCIPYGSKADVGNTRTVPKPWNATYLKLWYGFLKAVSDHYASNPQFLMIAASGPTSVSEEMSLPGAQHSSKVCPIKDGVQAWMNAGYTPAKYEGAWSDVFSKFAALFPNQYVSLALYDGLPIGSSGNNDSGEVSKTPQDVISAGLSALGGRFAVEANGLVSTSPKNAAYRTVKSYHGRAVTGFELATSAVTRPQTEGGVSNSAEALCQALRAGVEANVDFIEIYQEDASSGDASVQSVLDTFAKQLQPPIMFPRPGRPVPFDRRLSIATGGASPATVCP